MAKPVLGTRQLLVVAIILLVMFGAALVSLNTQRTVSPAHTSEQTISAPVANATSLKIASQVEAKLSGDGFSYADTQCPGYYPATYPSALTCTSQENGKQVYIDLHFSSRDNFDAKVLRPAEK